MEANWFRYSLVEWALIAGYEFFVLIDTIFGADTPVPKPRSRASRANRVGQYLHLMPAKISAGSDLMSDYRRSLRC